MRLATYTLTSDPQKVRIGVQLNGNLLDLVAGERTLGDGKLIIPASMKGLLALGEAGLARARAVLEYAQANPARFDSASLAPESTVRFLPPVPDADKFLCVGKNYRTHLEELRKNDLIKEMPGEPTGFIKLNSCLTGHDAEVTRRETVNASTTNRKWCSFSARPPGTQKRLTRQATSPALPSSMT